MHPPRTPQEPPKNPTWTAKEPLKNLQKNLKRTAKLQTSTPKEPCACFIKNTRFLIFSFWHCHPYRQVWNDFCELYWPLPNRWKLVRDDVNTASLCLHVQCVFPDCRGVMWAAARECRIQMDSDSDTFYRDICGTSIKVDLYVDLSICLLVGLKSK